MKKILLILFVVIPGIKAVYADTWFCPPEVNYCSENRLFFARVIAAKESNEPFVEVFHTEVSIETFLWKATLGNDYSPGKAFVSNEGEYVVTINECSGRVHGGFGDYVVAFYNKEGLIKNYSLEQILHYPDKIDKKEFRRLTRRTTSGRSWARKPVFFDSFDNKLFFCAWLTYGQRWLAWNVSTGKEIKIEDLMVQRWNKKGRLWALKEIEKGTDYYYTPYQFLGNLKNPDDRPLIEKLLLDDNFVEVGRRRHAVRSATDHPIYHLERYTYSSSKRLLADRILANWDGKHFQMRSSWMQPHYYLGKVEGIVKLPRTDEPKKGTLWIYLIPSTVNKNKWYEKPLIHRLVVPFSDFSFRNFDLEHTKEFPFAVAGVTPGEYWLKAVLDRTKPISKQSDRIYLPQQGDYVSLESPVITVKARKTVDKITIDCTHELTNAAD